MQKQTFRPGLILGLFALCALLAGVSQAQMARVAVYVTDTAEEPLKGATLTITNQSLNYEEVKTTDKRGRIRMAFIDGTVPYNLKIELEGYQTNNIRLKPQVGLSMTRTYRLKTLEQARAEAGGQQQASGGGQPAAGQQAQAAPVRRYTPAQISFNEGVEALKLNDFDTAEQKFLMALSQDSSLTVTHSALASVYIEKGNGEQALEQAQKFAAIDPENPRTFRLLYEAHKLRGDEDAAEEALEQMKRVAGGKSAAALRYNEGTAALRSGDYEVAKARLEEALAADPELMDAVKALAILSINQKDFARAAQLSDQYLTARPNDNDVTLKKIRWQSYSALGDAEKTATAFEAVKAADPGAVAKDLLEAAQVDFNGGNTDAAIARLEQVLELDPKRSEAHYWLGLCQVNQGKNAEARASLERFIKEAPQNPLAASAKDMLQYVQ
ncbi:MAG: tetratricopeptide repeat protein [Acidobacteriota bacterium]